MWGSDLPMWPCPRGPLNNLRAGDIVTDRERPGELYVVTSEPGSVARCWPIPSGPGDVALMPLDEDGRPWRSSSVITSNPIRQWIRVPHESLGAVHRVVSAHYGWRPLSGRTEADVAESGPAEDDHEPWHLLAALLSDEGFSEATADEWPGCFDLALGVAAELDAARRGSAG